MKIELFNEFGTGAKDTANKWLEKNKNVTIEDIKLSSSMTPSGSIYCQVMIVYTEPEAPNTIQL
jgi:hypothetical protein